MGTGLRSMDGNPAAPPYSNGPYKWDQHVAFEGGFSGVSLPGDSYYVDRNVSVSGDGKSWENAFKTFAEGIAALNAAYTLQRSVNTLFVGEGWYVEVPGTDHILTASDCFIVGVAPGSHDSTVIYGSSVAGTATTGAAAPILTIHGNNVTVANLGFFTWEPTEPSVRVGGHASHSTGYKSVTGTRIINCNFVRDQADGSIGGIQDASSESTVIEGCYFSTSCKDYGVQIVSNGVTNPVNSIVRNCRFVGTPIGVDINAGHNALVEDCLFQDDTTDRADTVDTPIDADGSTNSVARRCYSEQTTANVIQNGTSTLGIHNYTLATPA